MGSIARTISHGKGVHREVESERSLNGKSWG